MDIRSIAEALLRSFNRSEASSYADFCDESLTVKSALLSIGAAPHSLDALIAGCQSMFPGIIFHGDPPRSSGDTLLLSWRGEYTPGEPNVGTVYVPCTCRLAIANGRIREISFAVNSYQVMLQLQRICSDPGQPIANSALVNQCAAESLRQAVVLGNALIEGLSVNVVLHASVTIYRDINKGLHTDTLRLDGVGKIEALLTFIRDRFGQSVDLVISGGISQGHTTTFRGRISGKIGTEIHCYNSVLGFVSPNDCVTECWVKIMPPPTLRECLR